MASRETESQEWVRFNDDDDKEHAKRPNTHVLSARGSVRSAESSPIHTQSAAIEVSAVENVDELQLRRQTQLAENNNQGNKEGNNANNEEDGNNTSNNGGITVRTSFDNGDVIVTLLPVNERLPWLTPAKFRPELVPEELMAPVLTLTVEDYVHCMEKLTSDLRFSMYNIFYKRVLFFWITTAFLVLLALLFSGFQGIELFACGVAWLVMNASAIFICLWLKLKLNKKLEKCMAAINGQLIKHKVVLIVDDRGHFSCHKVNLCFIFLDPQPCIKKLENVLKENVENEGTETKGFDRERYLRETEEFEDVEVVVTGNNNRATALNKLDRKHDRAERLLLHYVQRWGKDYLRRRLDWVMEDVYGRVEYASNSNPRHLRAALCPCQYIEEHLRNKRHAESLNPCVITANPCHWCD